MEHCIFHSDRIHFDKMTREIQRAKIIPRLFVHRLAMAVCSCRRNKMNVNALMTEKDLKDKIKDLQERLSIETSWPDSLVNYLYQILSADVLLSQDSKCRFIYVLHQAIFHNNYDMLTREAVSSNPEEVVKKPEVKKPVPQHIKDMIIRRKLRKAKYKADLTLSMFAGNLRSLQSSVDYNKLISASKGVVYLTFNNNTNTKHMQNNRSVTEALVAGDDVKSLKDFCSAMRSLASKEQQKMDAYHRRIQQQRQAARARRKFMYYLEEQEYTDCLEPSLKDDLTDNFNKKLVSQKKNQSSAHQNINQSVLDGGHCLSCLKPFNGLKSNAAKEPCRYHPGYIYCERWTCCGLETLDDKPTATDHSQNGCCTDRHVWRPHKKANLKPGVNHKERKVGVIERRLVNKNSKYTKGRDVMYMYFDSLM